MVFHVAAAAERQRVAIWREVTDKYSEKVPGVILISSDCFGVSFWVLEISVHLVELDGAQFVETQQQSFLSSAVHYIWEYTNIFSANVSKHKNSQQTTLFCFG